ncbi:MAG: UDP-N-acetylmuramoyl-L-alanine--D-glutamate ligase [Puniceicoccales bacterium]|jgi:UDP-N-acetylmuramoylalanine--D-glutamate ligase|nr:UDP-N-acetylmuramoyl-L-alanine--D-glutamate ligase [Puniceicoccales bacterium]
MDIPKNIAPKLSRPVAVLGWGVSGKSVSQLLAHIGVPSVAYDEKGGDGVLTTFGPEEISQHDLVVYSPGFAQSHPWMLAARRAGVTCLGELDFASLFWAESMVAVTGTNGKTTLTEFLVFAHKRNGREAVAVGNIGYPLSRVFELTGNRMPLPVCEVSSFQAEDMRHFAPTALLWTNFDEDHLDRHPDLETYFRAKFKLIDRLASRRLIVGESVVEYTKKFGMELPSFTEVATRAEVAGKIPDGSVFSSYPQSENYALALRYWTGEGLPVRALEDAARVFAPARHRLSKVAEINGISYWNDSKGTNFHAVLSALEEITGQIHWIGGGKWKGGNVRAFAEKLAKKVKYSYLIGETGPELHDVFVEQGIPSRVFKKLPEAVFAAHQAAKTGDAILLSPGFSSFDMFKSYADRGLAFEQTVLGLKNSVATSSK